MEETIQPIKWTSIEKGDDHMTMREFRSCVLSGAFIDDDGCGYYATSTARSSVRAVLLDVRHNRVPYIWATHVVWFNKLQRPSPSWSPLTRRDEAMSNSTLHPLLEAYTWALKNWNESRDELQRVGELGPASSIEYWQWQCDQDAERVQTALINFINAKRTAKERDHA